MKIIFKTTIEEREVYPIEPFTISDYLFDRAEYISLPMDDFLKSDRYFFRDLVKQYLSLRRIFFDVSLVFDKHRYNLFNCYPVSTSDDSFIFGYEFFSREN